MGHTWGRAFQKPPCPGTTLAHGGGGRGGGYKIYTQLHREDELHREEGKPLHAVMVLLEVAVRHGLASAEATSGVAVQQPLHEVHALVPEAAVQLVQRQARPGGEVVVPVLQAGYSGPGVLSGGAEDLMKMRH